MVNILVLGEAYDKVFNHLDMLHAPLEEKGFTCAKQVKPYYYWKTPTISPLEIVLALRSKVSLIPVTVSYDCLLRVNAAGTKLQLMKDYNC
ncbi:hypothetical protein Tco_0869453 [Tanacetum coccineum]